MDIFLAIVRASLLNARLPYLLNLREQHPTRVDRTIAIIERPRLRTSFRHTRSTLHFLMAGLLLMAVVQASSGEHTPLEVVLILLGGALLYALLDFLIEGSVARNPENLALRLAPVGRLLDVLLTPLSWLLSAMLGVNSGKAYPAAMTDEDLRIWVEGDQPAGALDKGGREMIYSIFQFGETLVREIMVPRIDVLALDLQTTFGEARKTFTQAGHSRLPVYAETIDDIIGLLYAKDLLTITNDTDILENHRHILRQAYFVPETKKVTDLLADMQARSVHMAVIVDEYGGVSGIVTLEDIMEEIVGEIRDEYDQGEEQIYEKISDDEFVFLGRADLDEINELMGVDFPSDDVDSIGGLIYGEIGRIPSVGDKIMLNGLSIAVEKMIGRRINKVRVCRIPCEEQESED